MKIDVVSEGLRGALFGLPNDIYKELRFYI
jgi:hypothetical protein